MYARILSRMLCCSLAKFEADRAETMARRALVEHHLNVTRQIVNVHALSYPICTKFWLHQRNIRRIQRRLLPQNRGSCIS